MKSIGIIPARFSSTRFPGKPLAIIKNKSMVQRVYENSLLSALDKVIIATDNDKIYNHIKSFGGEVILTSSDHQTGTERCAEAIEKIPDRFDVVVNIQGDEPFIDPVQINLIISSFEKSETEIATLIEKFSSLDDLLSPNSIKVVKDMYSNAVFFSRSVIPYPRDIEKDKWLQDCIFYSHVGIYGYRSNILKELVKLPTNEIEVTESLEQLRWLLNGYKIKVTETEYNGITVDTPEDLEKAIKFLNNTNL